MQNATRKLDRYGKQMQKVGAGLTVGVTVPLIALGVAAVKNYDEQAKAIAQVEQGLLTTGGAVGFVTKELVKQAEELQNNSLFGDEVILKDVTAQLLTFTNISGDAFKRASQAALDLSVRLGTDLKGNTIQLGKALNDPILGLSALGRSGIQFTEDQKGVIKTLVETGDIAKAQGIILTELEKQYGGSASAAAKAGLGPFTQFKNILGDITEDFGAIILDGLNPFVEKLKDLALGFKDLSPSTKKFIVILTGVAAAIGPLLALAGTILPAIGTGLALLTGPIGLVVAALTAIGVVIYKNWLPIKQTLIDIANYFIDLYNESTVFRIAVEAVISVFKNLFAVGKFVFGTIGNLISTVADNMKKAFKNTGAIIKAVLTGNIEEIPTLLVKNFAESTTGFKKFSTEVKKDFADLKTKITDNISEGVNNALRGKKYALLADAVDTEEVEDKVADAVKNGLKKGGTSGGGSKDFTPQIQRVGTIDEVEIKNPLGTVAEQLAESAKGIKVTLKETGKELTAFQENADLVGLAVGDAFESMTGRFLDSLGLADTGFQGFIKNMAQTITKLIAIMLSQSIANAISGATASGASTGPAAVFTTPAFIATAVGGVLAAFAAIPKFATGGIVGGNSFTGDNNLVRVNSGELILNMAQQKNLAAQMGGRGITLLPSLDFSGDKLRVLLNRVDSNRNRLT